MRSILPGLMLALIGAAAAAPASAAPPQAIELRASEVTVRGGGDVIEASGNVRITDGRSAVRAGRAVYAIRARRIELSAGVAIDSTEGDLRADSADPQEMDEQRPLGGVGEPVELKSVLAHVQVRLERHFGHSVRAP